MQRFQDGLSRLYFPLLALICLACCWRPISGAEDVWAHAAIGRWIAQHGAVPHETLFLWGASPIRWVYHSWLSQWTFYQLLRVDSISQPSLGPFLILLLTSTLVIATFALLWCYALRQLQATRAPFWLPLVFALAIYCSSLRFHPRPEIFTALFLCITLLLITRTQSKNESQQESKTGNGRTWRWRLLAGVLLFIAWANFHGAVAIGLMIVWLTAICDALQDKLQKRIITFETRVIFLLAIAVSLAIWINPYGLEYWNALRPVGGVTFTRIDEWKPFWREPILNFNFVAGEAILVSLAFFAWLGNSRRRLSHLAWLILMSAMFLSARRHLWLLPIVSLAVFAANARTLSTLPIWQLLAAQGNATTLKLYARAITITLLILALCQSALPPDQWGNFVAKDLSLKSSQFVKDKFPNARVYSDYENSSYLQWRFAGKPPLFIDLLNAYPDNLILDYLDIINARPRGKQLLQQKNVQVVILRKVIMQTADDRKRPLAKLTTSLDKSPLWRREYSGDDGNVWARRDIHSTLATTGH